MASALGEKEESLTEEVGGRRERRSARVIDFATRSTREPEVSRPRGDRLGLIVGLVVIAVLLWLTYWTLRSSQQRPIRATESGPLPEPASMIRIPIAQPSDDRLVEVEAPVVSDGEIAGPLPMPDLAPVLADPPSTPGNIAPLFPEPELQPVGKSPPKPTVVYESGGGSSPVKFAFDGSGDGKFARTVEAEATSTRSSSTSSAKAITAPKKAAVATTVGKGTVFPAVLETAIDTDVPGGVRAVVTNSILSSDGKMALVPKSSRMIGKYRTRESKGQKSAFVVWTQIVRPDGTKVDIGPDSTGSGDKRFFEAFASAQLVSVISGQTTPDFRARQGEPVRIMAARDLDLSKPR